MHHPSSLLGDHTCYVKTQETLTSFFHSLARADGSQSSLQIRSRSSCSALQLGFEATARSAILNFFSRSAR